MTTSRRPGSAAAPDADTRSTRRASLSIGLQIMLASAILVLGIVVVAIVFILHQSLPREQIDRDASSVARVYVDTSDVYEGLVVIGIGAVLFAGLVSWFIARRAVRPLGDALRRQREFVADASHELRTPLSVLDARIQVFERRLASSRPPSTADTAATVAELRADSRALVDIVTDLLLAAGGDQTRPEPLTAGPVIVEAVDSLHILATERGVRLSVDVDDLARVSISVAALRRSVVALVDNALAHSPADSTVSIVADRVGGMLRLTVVDEGTGIRGIAPERVFDRFAHSGSEPGRSDGDGAGDGRGGGTGSGAGPDGGRQSFGIGLALVREIATRQGGTVRVERTSAAGTAMALELPIVE